MADPAATTGRSGWTGAAQTLIDGWALLGGGLLLGVVLMNVASVIGGVVWVPFPGDFELTEVGVAVAAFTFLPFCELHGKNVTADIFTSKAGPRTVAAFKLLASVVAFLFALLLLWRMYDGMLSQKEYNYTTTILQFPHWIAFPPILMSLALLAVAALITFLENGRAVTSPERHA